MRHFQGFRQSQGVFSYNMTDFPPIVARQHTNHNDTIASHFNPLASCSWSYIMIRIFPKAWTAFHMSVISLATWALCATDALGTAAPLFLH